MLSTVMGSVDAQHLGEAKPTAVQTSCGCPWTVLVALKQQTKITLYRTFSRPLKKNNHLSIQKSMGTTTSW